MPQPSELFLQQRRKTTGEMLSFLLKQQDLTSLAAAGGREGVRELLPAEYQDHFDLVQPGLVDTLLQPKNRRLGSLLAAGLAMGLDAGSAMDPSKKVCYRYFPMSAEIMAAFDLVDVVYEGPGLLSSALFVDGGEDGVDRIEAEGIPDHLCSTQKVTSGYFLLGVVRKPDVLIKVATPCDASNALYEWAAHKLDIPLIVVETPYYHNERGLKLMIREIERMIEELEKLTGTTLDEDKLRQFVTMGNQTVDYILKTQELRKLSPCPDTSWHRALDTGNAAMIGGLGPLMYFKTIYEDAQERAAKGQGVIPEGQKEKRFAWGYAWQAYDLSFFNWLEEEHGVTYTADTLTYFPPDIGLVDTSSMRTMIEGLAWRCMNMPMGRQSMGFSDVWIADILNVVKAYRADALVLGGHMACKHFWALNKLLSDRVREEAGIPTLRFEMDMYDKRFTPPAELRRIIDEFMPTLRIVEQEDRGEG